LKRVGDSSWLFVELAIFQAYLLQTFPSKDMMIPLDPEGYESPLDASSKTKAYFRCD
jgi:hypothetical protein